MYDIFDDEIDEMYENKGKSSIKLGKGISPMDPLESLTQEKFIVLNERATLMKAIRVCLDQCDINNPLDGSPNPRNLARRCLGPMRAIARLWRLAMHVS